MITLIKQSTIKIQNVPSLVLMFSFKLVTHLIFDDLVLKFLLTGFSVFIIVHLQMQSEEKNKACTLLQLIASQQI